MPEGLSLWAHSTIFAVAAAVVWAAGTRITHYVDIIARRTGIGYALAGVLLLAGVTSLPELAVTVTASARGNAPLALNNLLGSVALHVTLLAIADAAFGRDALTSVIAQPVVLLQMALNVLILTVFAAGAAVGDVALAGVGAWSCLVLAMYLASIWFIERSRNLQSWVPRGKAVSQEEPQQPKKRMDPPLGRIAGKTIVAGLAILAAGFALARSGEAIAEDTGLSQGFAGFVLISLSTSLPEITTMFTAVRMGRTLMAVSEVFGSNLFTIALVFAADLAYPGGPILDQAGTFSIFAALTGGALTTLYLIGLIERRDRTVARMGIDSIAVLLTYSIGTVLLYRLR